MYNKHDKINEVIGVKKKHREDKRLPLSANTEDIRDNAKHKHHHSHKIDDKYNQKRDKSHSPASYEDHKPTRKRHHSTDLKPSHRTNDLLRKSNTFVHNSPRRRSKSSRKSQEKVSDIWYCQVETNSPFKKHKKDFEINKKIDHKSLKETATLTNKRDVSTDKRVLNALSSDVRKSKIHHFKAPTTSTVIKAKQSDKSSREKARVNKKTQHKSDPINLEQKIEDGLKIYFAKLQSIIDKKFEAILPTKKDEKPPEKPPEKPRKREDSKEQNERKHRKPKQDKQTATIKKRERFVPERDDNKPIIKKIMDGDAVNNPSTSVMYVKPPPFNLVYEKNSSKCIDLYGAEAPEERRRRRSGFWVEGVEPAKRDRPVAPGAAKPAPNLQSKILSIVGIPSQTGDYYRKKPFEDMLENKHKLKRFKLYYRYLQESSNTCNPPSHVPSESCKVLSDRSDPAEKSNPPAKSEDNTYINIKLDDYHFYLKDKNPICLGKEAKKRQMIADKIAFNAKSDTDISYSSLNTFDLNKTDDVTLQEFYCNIDYFKRSFEKSDNRVSRFQVMQFLENMHQLYLVSRRKREKSPVQTKEVCTNTDRDVFVNKSVDAAIAVEEKIDKATSYQEIVDEAAPKNDSDKSTSTFVVGRVENNSNTTTVASEMSKSEHRLIKKREKALQSDNLVDFQSVLIPLHPPEMHSTPMQSDPIVEPQRNKTVALQLPENFLPEEKSRSIALQLDYIPDNKIEYTDKIKKKHLKTFKAPKIPKMIPVTPPVREAPEVTDLPKPAKTKQKKPKEPNKKDDLSSSIITLPSIPEYKDPGKKKKRCSSAPRNYQHHKDDFNFKLKRSQSEIDFKKPDKEETFDLPNDSQSRSHTKAHSLDRYLLTSKPILNEHAYNSTLMITKEYRSADVSSYHKRKKYDEAIRRKMKKKMGQQEKQLDRVFEVRYVTLDGCSRNAEALERIPESRECLTRSDQSNLISFVNCLCASLKAKRSSTKLRKRKSDTRKPIARKKKTPRIPDGSFDLYNFPSERLNPINSSCPALKASDSSFDFLYPDESESGEEAGKQPVNSSILGFSLTNDDVTVSKRAASLDSPCSETSGYASSRSKHSFTFTNFFKKPKMAALLKPQVAEGVFGRDCTAREDVFVHRSISSANILRHDKAGFCQSAPCCRTLEETASIKRFSSDTNLLVTRENSLPSEDSLPDDSEEYSLLEKMVDSDLYVANLSSCSIVLVESSSSIGASKAPGRRSSDVRRLIGKKFFENIVEMYENESSIGGGLYEDGDFVKELMSKGRRRKLKAEKRSFGREIKRVLRKVLTCNGKKRVEKREPVEMGKPVENDYQKKLQALAHGALKYFSSLVQAVAVNNKLDDELKMYGILRLLQAIENGQFKFLRKFAQQKTNVEVEVKEQIKETFSDVYAIAKCEASNCRRKLSSNDSKLMAAFACKYRIGLLSRTDVIASCLGKGLFHDEDQLKAAVIFLLKTTSDVNRDEFEEYYRKYAICCL